MNQDVVFALLPLTLVTLYVTTDLLARELFALARRRTARRRRRAFMAAYRATRPTSRPRPASVADNPFAGIVVRHRRVSA